MCNGEEYICFFNSLHIYATRNDEIVTCKRILRRSLCINSTFTVTRSTSTKSNIYNIDTSEREREGGRSVAVLRPLRNLSNHPAYLSILTFVILITDDSKKFVIIFKSLFSPPDNRRISRLSRLRYLYRESRYCASLDPPRSPIHRAFDLSEFTFTNHSVILISIVAR